MSELGWKIEKLDGWEGGWMDGWMSRCVGG